MSDERPCTVLCLASYKKGDDFLRECKRLGCHVILITLESLKDEDWPRDSIDEIYAMSDIGRREELISAVGYLARTREIDRIIPLDDYDVETAAVLREHLRCPGMGDTTARYFRDKLAMRVKAREHGILVPEFVHVLNYDRLRRFMDRVPSPWVLKPRSEAAAVGIKKISEPQELWAALEDLGDRQTYFLLERFIHGDIFHVDAIVSDRDVVFAQSHRYGSPPLAVVHHGGLFTTRTLDREGEDVKELERLNREVLSTLGLVRGVTHTEFIRATEDERFYFLETAARVGGANISEAVEAATGINLWHEWARLEVGRNGSEYRVPEHRNDYAGIIISLARQERPDLSSFDDPEIVWRLDKTFHAGLIVCSPSQERVDALIEEYSRRFRDEFLAIQPPPDRPTA